MIIDELVCEQKTMRDSWRYSNEQWPCCTERLISAKFFLISVPIFNNADWKKWYHTHATPF